MWNDCENWQGLNTPPTPLLSLPWVTSVAKYVCLCVHPSLDFRKGHYSLFDSIRLFLESCLWFLTFFVVPSGYSGITVY